MLCYVAASVWKRIFSIIQFPYTDDDDDDDDHDGKIKGKYVS